MENRNSLHNYVNEMDQWLQQFNGVMEELENNPMAVMQSDSIAKLQGQFEKVMKDVNYYKDNPQALQVSLMNDLQQQASNLYQGYRAFMNQKPKKVHDKKQTDTKKNPVPIGGHNLPALPYSYDALEPYIDREIMRLHHTKHHQSYVDNLNKAEKEMEKARRTNDFNLIKHWEREAAFNGAGHYLHTIFWDIMSPEGGGKPTGSLLKCIEKSFGSFDSFKKHFSEAAKQVEGVGWAILVWSPRSHRLEILQAEKHQNLTQWDVIPLLVLDVWEHAYYLQYKNEKNKYVDRWWNVVCWDSVAKRLEKAKQVMWQPF